MANATRTLRNTFANPAHAIIMHEFLIRAYSSTLVIMYVVKDVVVSFLAAVLATCILSPSVAQSQASHSDSPTVVSGEVHETSGVSLQTIEGRVQVEGGQSSDWISKARVVVDGGSFYGYLRANGEFQIHSVPPGSYLIEVVSPNHEFQPARVDISSKSGKIRARKVNLLKSSSVSYLPYPLKFKVEKQAEFFVKREPWSALAMLKNPMVSLHLSVLIATVRLTQKHGSFHPTYY